MERATGIEPVHRAWKARALPTELCPLRGRGSAGILPRGLIEAPDTQIAPDNGSSLQDWKAQIVPILHAVLSGVHAVLSGVHAILSGQESLIRA